MRKRKLNIIPILLMALLLQGCSDKAASKDSTEVTAEASSETQFKETSVSEGTLADESDEGVDNSVKDITEITEKEIFISKKYIRQYSSDGSYKGGSETEYNELGKALITKRYDKNNSVNERIEHEYDANGNALKVNYFNSHGELYEYFEYEYDSNGNRIKELRYNVALEKVKYLYTWDYDANGNQTKWYKNDSLYFEWEYDVSGNRIREVEYLTDGRVYKDWSIEYDSAGNRIKKETFEEDAGGTYYARYTWEYDSNGNAVVEELSGFLGQYRDEKEYDAAGNCTQVIRYSEKGGIILNKTNWSYDYDERGNIIRKCENDKDWTEYKYDEKGNIIKECEDDGDWTEYEYVYSN